MGELDPMALSASPDAPPLGPIQHYVTHDELREMGTSDCRRIMNCDLQTDGPKQGVGVAVDRLARIFDHDVPGWARRADTRTLNTRLPDSCPIHQVYGNYGLGLIRLCARYGVAEMGALEYAYTSGYADALWVAEVNKRRHDAMFAVA